MDLKLPEIQISFFISVSILTFVIALIKPHNTDNARDFKVSRHLLMCASALVALHFLIQYIVHKNVEDVVNLRLMLNLLFGFPSSYLFTMSVMYLLRRGKISVKEWIFIPQLYITALIILIVGLSLKVSLSDVLPVITMLYGVELIYCVYMQLRQYFITRRLQRSGDHSFDMVLRWTKWGIFMMAITGLGFPMVLLVNDVGIRSAYGVMSNFVVFVFILGMVGYTLNHNIAEEMKRKYEEGRERPSFLSFDSLTAAVTDNNSAKDEALNEKVAKAAEEFVSRHMFTRQGITVKEAAEAMDVTPTQLKQWLHGTEYGKFNSWIAMLRIEYAKELMLADPDASSEIIAEKCGMCDRQYFQSQFSKYVGVTPSKWIRSMSENDR